jgi:hypothetical protein
MMAGKKTMRLTLEELEAIRDEAAESARRDGFSTEEMQAIREQYLQRIEEESKKREDLEWRLRFALARLGDLDSATEKLRAIQEALKRALGVDDEDKKKTQPKIARVTPPAAPARALRKEHKRVA